MIEAVVTIVTAAEKRDEILKSLRSIVGPTRVREGCLDCRVCIDAMDSNVLSLMQMWDAKESLEHHVQSDGYRLVLAVMESSVERPEIAFHTISKSEGLEVVKKLREAQT